MRLVVADDIILRKRTLTSGNSKYKKRSSENAEGEKFHIPIFQSEKSVL